MRRPLLLLSLSLAGVAAIRRRRKTGQAEKNLWTEATAAPDLR